MIHPAKYWKVNEKGKVHCNLCPRGCNLKEGQRGFCFVRQNLNGKMMLTTYGQGSGFQMDPIEKKPLNHFYPGSHVLSFGMAGCNLGCKFCQNWDLSKATDLARVQDQKSPADVARLALEQGAKSVAMTYNDPVNYIEYGHEVAKACREAGIKVVLVTAGYIQPIAWPEFFEYVDAANVDLKAFSESFYKKLCKGHLEPVLETLKYIRNKTNIWLEITNLIIPSENDSPSEIRNLATWIKEELGEDTPLHFSAFHPDYKMTSTIRTPHATLTMAREIANEVGLKYVYTGNLHDLAGDQTNCPNCGAAVIQRDWYQILGVNLQGANCKACGEEIAGCFED